MAFIEVEETEPPMCLHCERDEGVEFLNAESSPSKRIIAEHPGLHFPEEKCSGSFRTATTRTRRDRLRSAEHGTDDDEWEAASLNRNYGLNYVHSEATEE